MNFNEARSKTNELLQKHLGDKAIYWSVSLTDSKRTMGRCQYNKPNASPDYNGWRNPKFDWVENGGFIILSTMLIQYGSDEEVIDTILHEIAHAIAGPLVGHDWRWRSVAHSIGCNGDRVLDIRQSEGLARMIKEESNWTGTCPVCGYQYHVDRLTPKRKHGYHVRCGQEAKLVWKRNVKY